MSDLGPLIFDIEPGELRTGYWCDRCNTAAIFELDMISLREGGVSLLDTIRRCDRCDDEDDEP